MLITGIKSRPVYDQLKPMSGGLRHVLAAQGSGGAALLRLLGEMSEAQRQATTLLYSTETFSGHNHLAALRDCALADLREFSSNQALLDALRELLGQAHMGTRLYLAGSESFIGTAMQVAGAYDMNRDEVLREHSGTLVRRVWCVHCDTYTENVTQRVFRCPGCGLDLIVRDHYSRRLAAFQGVKADGEVPGELPPAEELDT
ncbi:dimethylamine monooxygenase subunit DmmA family protein [Pseudomonas sp. AN-1]|uniref:dimethylamine monooxygenase subunit DmmA family protein n=1 Tax=Pseudomonas sp. AN-1 TaxID=3096605 RepID=UPI002A69FAFE|nr:dimethylamine monooxygenase subunit DmmA family protein [Pseudomonas sp. AN-1]WPP46902.1 dimethylamine monooxygenase subunit DmmA family protein [Pseudomonas sp. AN-1]